jgi:hypothetical protein
MDPVRFDTMARTLATAGTRRGLVRLLTVFPLGMPLIALLGDAPDAIADDDDHGSSGRRKRRKAKHRHQTGNNKENRKGERKGQDKDQGKRRKKCVPDSLARTCAGACATVTNNCGAQVECGSCACTPLCAECETCNDRTGLCEPRSANEACGPGASCVSGQETPRGTCDGAGNCQSGTLRDCDPYNKCDGNVCATTCDSDDDCLDGYFCDGNDHCVELKDQGEACGGEGECLSGFCEDDFCCESACNPQDCLACDRPGFEGQCVDVSDIRFCF